MEGMSERQYATRVGLSRGAVQKAKASGRLVLHEDGSIDAVASDALRTQATDPSKTRKTLQSNLKPVSEAAVSAVGETLREQGLAAPPIGSGTTYLQAKTPTEVLKARERRLRLQTLKGELIDRVRALSLVFRLARQERDAWVNWPARAAAPHALSRPSCWPLKKRNRNARKTHPHVWKRNLKSTTAKNGYISFRTL